MSNLDEESEASFQEKLTSENRQEIATQILQLESLMHDAWREGRKKQDGTFEPRMKDTNDPFWIMARWAAKADIANSSGPELPVDLEAENRSSAEVAIPLVWEAKLDGKDLDVDFVETASVVIHDKWMERRISVGYDQERIVTISAKPEAERSEDEAGFYNKWSYDAKNMVPYESLTEEEKDKDKAIIRIAIQLHNKEINPEVTEALRLSPTEEEVILGYFDMVGIDFLSRFHIDFKSDVNLNSIRRVEDLTDQVQGNDKNRLVKIINIINSVIKANKDEVVPESEELSYGSFTYGQALSNDMTGKGNMGVIIKKRLGEYWKSYS